VKCAETCDPYRLPYVNFELGGEQAYIGRRLALRPSPAKVAHLIIETVLGILIEKQHDIPSSPSVFSLQFPLAFLSYENTSQVRDSSIQTIATNSRQIRIFSSEST